MADAANRGSDPDTLRGALARMADALLGLASTRLELAAVEYTEERGRVTTQVALLLAGVGCVLFALFFCAALVIVYFWDTHRLAAIVGVIVVFGVAGAALLWRRAELANTAPSPFALTLAELEKDRAAVARTMKLPPS
ncbi:MAG: phage holin family protein [Burkholderiales bacterium]|nr:phage holin family protein [Burkholderiales bacterium]